MENNVNQLVARVFGIVLVLVGILGFVPGITTDGKLLGIFGVNTLHNLIHLVTGAVLVWAGFAADGRNARLTNMVLGIVYLLVALVGFAAPGMMHNLVNNEDTAMNADNFLHLLLGVVFLGVSFVKRDETTRPMTGTRM